VFLKKTIYLPDSNKIVKKKVPVEKLITVCDTCVYSIDSVKILLYDIQLS
jgi:hypothetical protein